MVADLKTKKTDDSVDMFLAGIEDEQKREDCLALKALFEDVTGASPRMWGEAIVGFGEYTYKYKSGHGGEWFLVGFAPRKQNITLYLSYGFEAYEGLLGKLGKHKTGKACLYIKKLADVDMAILKELAQTCADDMKKMNS